MIGTRTRKILRDVSSRKGRTILVSLAIFIGVLGTVALVSLNNILVNQLQEDIKSDELSMFDVYITLNAGTEVDNDAVLETLRNVEGVTEVQAGASTYGYFKRQEEVRFDDIMLNAYWGQSLDNLLIEPMRLVDGEFPVAGQKQLALEKRAAERFNLKIGDTLIFRVLAPNADGELGSEEEWTISGLVLHPYPDQPNMNAYGLYEDITYLGGLSGFNALWVRFEDYKRDVAEGDKDELFASTLVNDTPYTPLFTFSEDPDNNSLIASVKVLTSVMSALAVISLVVSGFLVVNVISSIIVEQKRQIGVMKSMGATGFDTFYMYSGIAFTYGLIGMIPGVLLGIPSASFLAHILAPNLNTDLVGFQFDIVGTMLGVVMGLLIPVLASLFPVVSATRVLILDAMTDLGISDSNSTDSGSFSKLMGVLLFPFVGLPIFLLGLLPLPINLQQAIRGISRKQGRVVFTVITLSIAVGATMGIFAIFQGLTNGIGIFLDTFNVQLAVMPNEGRDPDEVLTVLRDNFQVSDEEVEAETRTKLEAGGLATETIESVLPALMNLRPNLSDKKIATVLTDAGLDEEKVTPTLVTDLGRSLRKGDILASIEEGFQFQVEFAGYEPAISAMGPPGILAYGISVGSQNPAFRFELIEGDNLSVNDDGSFKYEVILSEKLAIELNSAIGDTVTMQVPGNEVNLLVVGIAEFPLDQIWMDWRTLATVAGFTMTTGEGGAINATDYFQGHTVQLGNSEIQTAGVDSQTAGFVASLIRDGEIFSSEAPEIVVSSALVESNGYSVGDTVTLNSPVEGGSSGEFTVTGVLDLAGLPDQYRTMLDEEVILMDYLALAALEGAISDNIEVKPIPQAYFMLSHDPDPKSKDLEDELATLNDVMLEEGIPSASLNFVEIVEMISQIFIVFQVILQVVAGLIAIVGALGLLITLSMSVFERQKEIGVMRSIGAGSGTVAMQFLTEGLVIGFIAWLIGIPLSMLIQYELLRRAEFDTVFPFTVSWSSFAIGLVGMLVVTTIASLWPSISASRKTVSDILRYQ